MVQIINDPTRGHISGRIGAGIGRGLAEQLPQEIERGRLAAGLKQFEQEAANLSPMQQLARLSAIPGITPQMIQSFGALGQQQAKSQAFAKQAEPAKPPPSFPETRPQAKPPVEGGPAPSLTTELTSAKAQEGYIPKTREQIIEDARQKYTGNEAFYGNDPQNAIAEAEASEAQREKIAAAYQKKHENLTTIQDNVVNRLKGHSERLGVKIPADVYSDVEDEAIQATKPKDQGGEGLTEQQAMKRYGEKMDKISRDYEGIETLGNWGITGRKASETLRSMKALQKGFEERNDTENMADKLITENKISPVLAYSIAEPVSRVPDLNKEIAKLPVIDREVSFKKGYPAKVPQEYIEAETIKAAEKLSKYLKSNEKASPLAIAHELEKKGYDSAIFMNYLVEHRKDLNLKGNQDRQLDKPLNTIPTLNDWWLGEWSGLAK